MAQLFLAKRLRPKGQERTVVLKRILPHLAEDTAFVTMFLDEARIAARLHHPNVIEILDLGAEGDSYFIAMEYIHGEDLRRISKRGIEGGKRMSPPLVARVIAQACRGLDYAHRRTDQGGKPLRIVHRDVSPQNILVGFDGHVKVVDFGIAKAVDKATVTASGVIKGKHAYMSPEQALGREIDHRTDVFALGIVLYETLTATRLFRRATDLQTLKAVSECKVDPPSRVFPGVPAQLDPILMKALTKDLSARYQRASELADALEQWLGDRPDGSIEAVGRYVSELFAERLEKEKSEGKFVPSKSYITVGLDGRSSPKSSPPSAPRSEHTASLRPAAVGKTVTELSDAHAPAASPLESRTTDVTPAFLPKERVTEPVPAAGRRQTLEELSPAGAGDAADADAEGEAVTLSGMGGSRPPRDLGGAPGGTTPYGRPISTQMFAQLSPPESKTLIEPKMGAKTFIEPVQRVATPVQRGDAAGPPAPAPEPEPELAPVTDAAPVEPITVASGPVRLKSREGPKHEPKPVMWPWFLAAGLTTFAVAAVVTKVIVDKREL
ncbi:MAG: serine/threonine protein kinase, partial [Myxococcaceae bacterium]|nr:serine/threonine protein kinase [Myxococcaceae bacterium]